MLFALGSQDERVGFGAMGVLLSLMSNEVVDKELLLQCGVCPQALRKQEKLLKQLTKDTAKQHAVDILFDAPTPAAPAPSQSHKDDQDKRNGGDLLDTARWAEDAKPKPEKEVDLMAFASSSNVSSPATNVKPSKASTTTKTTESSDDSDSDDDDDDDNSQSSASDDDKPDDDSKPEKPDVPTPSVAFDFFSGAATSPKSNGKGAAASAAAEKPTSTFDILSFPTTPRSQVKAVMADTTNGTAALSKPVSERGQSNDPLLQQKPVLAPIHSAPHTTTNLFHMPSSSSSAQPTSPSSPTDEGAAFDYNHDIVTKLFPLPKLKQPPVRLATLQLLSSLLKELTYNPTSPLPSLAPPHIALLRETNNAFAEELKTRFKVASQGNFVLDVVEEETTLLGQTVYPKALIVSSRNLLSIEEKHVAGLGLEWRRGSNDWEKARKALQGYLLCRALRYALMKRKDPFYPLTSGEATVKVGDELSIETLVYVSITITHHAKPALLVIDTDSVLILSPSATDPTRGKVDTLIQLKAQEPFAVKGRPDQINIIFRAGLRPHPGSRRVKAGPGVTVEGGGAGPGATVGTLSGQKPMWVVGVVCSGGAEVAVTLRKNLEQGRIRVRKAMMNKMYKGFEQRQEEETTTIPAVKPGEGAQATPPIVPFSILNLLGDRQADIEEDDS